MTRDQVQTAINEGIPFMIKMADGEKYEVTDRYRVALGRTTVIIVAADDMPHILPLLTMTGISYLKAKKEGGALLGDVRDASHPAYSNNPWISSHVRLSARVSSPPRVALMMARFFCWSARIFSSTVPRAMSL